MSNTTVKLQIPLDKSLRDQIEKHARAMGFSSVQDFTRVMYSTVVRDNLKVTFKGEDDWGEPTPEAAARLNKQAAEAVRDSKAGRLKSYTSVDDFMRDLVADEADPA